MRNSNIPVPAAQWDWPTLAASLDEHGYALTPPVLSTADCAELISLYEQGEPWRSRVEPDRYRLGPGEYRHFRHPLPDVVTALREECYEPLAPIANTWHEQLGLPTRFPRHLKEFIDDCHTTGQTEPTPSVQRHQPNDFFCLHQEAAEGHGFPIQLMVMLSKPTKDFTGGELIVVENLPRAQSRARVVVPAQGHGVLLPTRHRPGMGTRCHYRINVRHGISTVHKGVRHALMVPFHDTA
jgi:uncharacterized protein